MGRSSENFREIVEAMRVAHGIRIVESAELAATMIDLLTDRTGAQEMGRRGHDVFVTKAGATARTVESLLSLLDRTPS
jgi:3-deoxy-D-manno-octulosonic-acid transferase